jgi:putative mycofactocin binding protein MftB
MKTYRLAPWARVRQERFGLLFYDTRSTTMTFVRSGDALVAPPFDDRTLSLRIVPRSPAEEVRVVGVLERLEAKGLVVAIESQ